MLCYVIDVPYRTPLLHDEHQWNGVYVMLQRVGSCIDRARATIVDGYRRAVPSVQHRYSQYDARRSLHTVRNECELSVEHYLSCVIFYTHASRNQTIYWSSTGSTRSDSHWTVEFRRQRTYRLEQSATSTTFARSVAQHLQAGTEDASLLIRPATLSRFRDFAAAYKSADLLTDNEAAV